MAGLTLLLWKSFKKRENSTKRPSNDSAETRTCYLKEGTSTEAPTFIIEATDISYNYCWFEFAYYYITDIIQLNSTQIEIHTQKDNLATYKDDIGSYTAFVERAASLYDDNIPDSALSQKVGTVSFSRADTTLNIPELLVGTYIMRVVGSSGIVSFIMDAEDLAKILSFAFTSTDSYPVSSTATVASEIIKTVFNPFDYILSVMWFPFDLDDYQNKVAKHAVNLGWWPTGVNCYSINNLTFVEVADPDSLTLVKPDPYYNDWRDYSNEWSEYSIQVPAIGYLKLDATMMNKTLKFGYDVDLITGGASFYINDGTHVSGQGKHSNLLYATGQIGVPIQVGQTTQNIAGIVSGVTSVVGAAASGSLIGTTSGLVNTVMSAAQPSKSVLGGNGTKLNLTGPISMMVKHMAGAEYPTTVAGRPLFQNKQISTLSGFIKCGAASVPIAGHLADKQDVDSQLNNGFYYE